MQGVQIREGGPTPLADMDQGVHIKGDLHRLGHRVSADLDPLEYESPNPYPLADLDPLRILSHCILSIVSSVLNFDKTSSALIEKP